MSDLTLRERELVALAAALGSNCAPCVGLHLQAARKAGLDDAQIRASIELADSIRQVPARKALAAALTVLGDAASSAAERPNMAGRCAEISGGAGKCGC